MEYSSSSQGIQVFIARYWIWVLVVAEILLVAFGVFVFLAPAYERFQQYSADDLAAREGEIQTVQQNTKQLHAALAMYSALDQTRVQLVRSFLPETSPFADLLFLVARIAERAGFSVTSFSVQASSDASKKGASVEKKTSLVQVSLAGKGYAQWRQFIDLMERQLPLMDLVTTDFRPQNTHQQFSFRTYSLP